MLPTTSEHAGIRHQYCLTSACYQRFSNGNSICENLRIAWVGDYESLKKFISEDLKLDSTWKQPGRHN